MVTAGGSKSAFGVDSPGSPDVRCFPVFPKVPRRDYRATALRPYGTGIPEWFLNACKSPSTTGRDGTMPLALECPTLSLLLRSSEQNRTAHDGVRNLPVDEGGRRP